MDSRVWAAALTPLCGTPNLKMRWWLGEETPPGNLVEELRYEFAWRRQHLVLVPLFALEQLLLDSRGRTRRGGHRLTHLLLRYLLRSFSKGLHQALIHVHHPEDRLLVYNTLLRRGWPQLYGWQLVLDAAQNLILGILKPTQRFLDNGDIFDLGSGPLEQYWYETSDVALWRRTPSGPSCGPGEPGPGIYLRGVEFPTSQVVCLGAYFIGTGWILVPCKGRRAFPRFRSDYAAKLALALGESQEQAGALEPLWRQESLDVPLGFPAGVPGQHPRENATYRRMLLAIHRRFVGRTVQRRATQDILTQAARLAAAPAQARHEGDLPPEGDWSCMTRRHLLRAMVLVGRQQQDRSVGEVLEYLAGDILAGGCRLEPPED